MRVIYAGPDCLFVLNSPKNYARIFDKRLKRENTLQDSFSLFFKSIAT